MNKDYLLHLADNNLILAQRNGAWCGHGPVLEQDIAITNITLDILGQARLWFQYAAELLNAGGDNATEDTLAFLRKENEYKNILLVELPVEHWGYTIMKQYFFSQFQFFLYQHLQTNEDARVAAIAEKSLKEITYHVKWSREWIIRLGDGTEESNYKMKEAINDLWMYTGEMFMPATYETGIPLASIKEKWMQEVSSVLTEATLKIPQSTFMLSGGKNGIHSEHLGYLLTDLQYMQRTYPGCEW